MAGMSHDIETTSHAHLEWPELESILAELATLARSDLSPEEIASELVDRTVSLLAAAGGAFWLADRLGSWRLLHESGAPLGGDMDEARRRLRAKVVESRLAQTIAINSEGNGYLSMRGKPSLLMGSPVEQEGQIIGLIEIFQRPTNDADVLRGNLRFLELVCQTAGDYLWRRELKSLRRLLLQNENLGAFVQRLHGSLDLSTVAYELVNEGRRLMGCDRLAVAIRRGSKFQLLAISGVDTIERRSNVAQRLEDLVSTVARMGEPLWYDGRDNDLSPQVFERLQSYLDETHVRCCGILPLLAAGPKGESGDGSMFAALVVEQFKGVLDRSQREAVELLADQGKLALFNALRYRLLPTLPFARHRDVLTRSSLASRRTAWTVAAGACLVAALCFVPVEFGVYAQGKLQPLHRQEVFAPMDARVSRLAVRHGEAVQAGQLLLELTSPQLEVEIQRVQGEYDTTRKRLSVVEAALLEAGAARDRDSDQAAEFAAEQEELIDLLESQRLQLELLAKERDKLVVRSPIAGELLTWDIEQLLKDRPVERGQSLLGIGNLTGRWVAEIEVPDDRIGQVLAAKSASQRPLAASFQLATNRQQQIHGTVREISTRTELNEDQRPVVRAVVEFDPTSMGELRPGATVYAHIHCGRKALGYVWFHRLAERIRGWAFYWIG
jgi:hypothetical protein